MKKLFAIAFLSLLAACSSNGVTPVVDSSTDTPSTTCCKISDTPGCCMHYGGSSGETPCMDPSSPGVCDFLPDPSSPLWQKKKDANGCFYWYAPPEIPIRCNPFPPDAPADTPADTPTDTPADTAEGG